MKKIIIYVCVICFVIALALAFVTADRGHKAGPIRTASKAFSEQYIPG